MAVHLDIRPRLTLPPEPRAASRRTRRLPPLAVPAVVYWAAMAALTYGFTRLGPNPLDDAPAAAATQTPRPEAPARRREAPAVEPASRLASNDDAPLVTPTEEPAAEAEPTARAEASAPLELKSAARAAGPHAPGEHLALLDPPPAPRATRSLPDPSLLAPFEFPEFTDSAKAGARYRASDGPRIDSLFEHATSNPSASADPSAPADAPTTRATASALVSCEAAIAQNNEQLTIGAGPGAPDVTRGAFAAILENGRYLSGCALPERTVVEICAAVRDGRAVGVTVTSNPVNSALNGCVRAAVARLQFPRNAHLDVTHTRFDAVRR